MDRKTYPFNLLSEIFGKADNLGSVYIQGLFDEIEKLPQRQKTYIRLRYETGLPRSTCAKQMNLSAYDIEQLEMQVHWKLRGKKEKGLLTAVSASRMTAANQQTVNLSRENQTLKQLVADIATGVVKPENIVAPSIKANNPEPKMNPVLRTQIDDLGLSTRAYRAFARHHWDTLYDITRHTRSEFLELRNVGSIVEQEVDQTLARYGLSFRDEPTETGE